MMRNLDAPSSLSRGGHWEGPASQTDEDSASTTGPPDSCAGQYDVKAAPSSAADGYLEGPPSQRESSTPQRYSRSDPR